MKRFLLQFVSIPTAALVGLFYWIGSQTSGGGEKIAAVIIVIYCALLLFFALGNFFTEIFFGPHALLMVGAILIVVGTYAYSYMQQPNLRFW